MPKTWTCPNCDWFETAHPKYGWSKHNDRAVEVHQTQLCPMLTDDVFTFVYIGENANLRVGMVDTSHRDASDLATMFPDMIYFLAHVQEV